MNVIDAENVFRQQIKQRWTDWNETDAEKSDWIRRLMNFTIEETKIILDRLSDSSYGKKPSVKDFFDIANKFLPQKPKQKPYQDIWVYLVYLGDAEKESMIGRWVPGKLTPVVFRCQPGSDITDDYRAEKFLDIVRSYISFSFRVMPSCFEIYLDEKSAFDRSVVLQEQSLFGKGMPMN